MRRLKSKALSTEAQRRRLNLLNEFEEFLQDHLKKDLVSCFPLDLLRFLVFLEEKGRGKTVIHEVDCMNLGRAEKGQSESCECPVSLSHSYMKKIVGSLKESFKAKDRGSEWDGCSMSGNPACGTEIKDFLQGVKVEQAEAHVVARQATPMMPNKLRRLCSYLKREAEAEGVAQATRVILLRDRAFFALQFFAGDRGGDLGKLLIQEVRRLTGGSGLVIRQTDGKTLKENIFVVKKNEDVDICPVGAVDDYMRLYDEVWGARTTGYMFSPLEVDRTPGRKPLGSAASRMRLRKHLVDIGLFEGETTHSLRGGCAVTAGLTHE